ncbi:MAG: zinc-ribbon domain-containing protein [Oscillospiraceae bacterium]|nr:zinc-ribbon domain-containing protein [Oscillospiraceae bacterium]
MNCMKCGRKIKDRQVFCEECLAIMDTYPVKPGTPIQLPSPPPKNATPAKTNKRRQRKPEEQIAYQRATIRWLSLAFIVAMLSFIIVTAMLLWVLEGPNLF